jgi:hypothetical protein
MLFKEIMGFHLENPKKRINTLRGKSLDHSDVKIGRKYGGH